MQKTANRMQDISDFWLLRTIKLTALAGNQMKPTTGLLSFQQGVKRNCANRQEIPVSSSAIHHSKHRYTEQEIRVYHFTSSPSIYTPTDKSTRKPASTGLDQNDIKHKCPIERESPTLQSSSIINCAATLKRHTMVQPNLVESRRLLMSRPGNKSEARVLAIRKLRRWQAREIFKFSFLRAEIYGPQGEVERRRGQKKTVGEIRHKGTF